MLKVEKGMLGGKWYLMCKATEEDKKLIQDFIDHNNGDEMYYCDNGVGLQLDEILDEVSRPVEEKNIKLVEEAIRYLNVSIQPKEKVYTIKVTESELQSLREVSEGINRFIATVDTYTK